MLVTAEGNASQGGRDAVTVVSQTRAREIASGLSQRAARLPWAQEVPSSNLGAPTKLFKYLAERSISGVNPWIETLS